MRGQSREGLVRLRHGVHDVDSRCPSPENVSKLRQISRLLLKQRREFIIATDWNTVLEQLVVSKSFRHYVKNIRADQSAPWSAHVAIAFDVMRQLVPLSLMIPQAPSHCLEEWLKRFLGGKKRLWLVCPALGDSLKLSQHKSECELEGSARCGRAAAARGKLPMFRLKGGFCTTIFGLAGSAALTLSAIKYSRAWCLRQGHE